MKRPRLHEDESRGASTRPGISRCELMASTSAETSGRRLEKWDWPVDEKYRLLDAFGGL